MCFNGKVPLVMRNLILATLLFSIALFAQAQQQRTSASDSDAVPRYVDPIGEAYGAVSRLSKEQLSALREKAEKGEPDAQVRFGMACETRYADLGLSIAQGRAEATKWYEKAALQGNTQAERLFASFNVGNPAEAKKWYEKAAVHGDIGSAYSLGQMYIDGNFSGHADAAQAQRWFLVAAEGGDTEAAYKLAALYESEKGIGHDDEKAARWYRVAAERGWKNAQLRLGILCQSGRGVPLNLTEAARWYREASDRYGDAAFRYATLVESGQVQGTRKTEAQGYYRKAVALFKDEALQGDSEAPEKLARMYEQGTGVSQSNDEAFFWYSIAQSEERPVTAKLERLKGKLPRTKQKELQRRVEKWINEF